MSRTKSAKNRVAQIEIQAPPIFISSAEYEGALRARRIIKNELDPKLQNANLFARYCYFNQVIDLYEAQQSGNYLCD